MGSLRVMIRRLKQFLPLLMSLALLAGPAHADIIHYKDGRSVQGRILERSATHITVDTEFGKLKIALSKIERIEERITPAEELSARRERIADDDAAALFELALWARDQELDKPFRELLREVIAASPGHPLANELLGRVKIDGRWMDPEDVAAYIVANAAEKLEQGFVFHEGQWRPEAAVMQARGFVRYKQAWVPRRLAETEMAVIDLKEMVGIELLPRVGETITLYSDLPDFEVDMLAPALEAQVQRFLATLEISEEERQHVLRYDIPIFLMPASTALARFIESGFVDRFVISDASKKDFAGFSNFSLGWPRPLIVLVQSGDHIDTARDADIGRLGVLSHQLEYVLVQRFAGLRPTPGWVAVGLAALAEGITNEVTTFNISTWDWDAPGQSAGPWVKGWHHFGHWDKHLRDDRMLANLPALRSVMYQRAGTLDSLEIGMSWSVTRFLLERHRSEFLAYLRAFGAGSATKRTAAPKWHEAAWDASFGTSLEEVEREWKAWAISQPSIDESDKPF